MNEMRRRFLSRFSGALVIAPLASLLLAGSSRAADMPRLNPDDPTAKSLMYIHESSDAERRCSGCQFYSGAADAQWGPCVIFPEKWVSARGVCNSWFKKAG